MIHTSGNSGDKDRRDGIGKTQAEISMLYESTMAELSSKALEAGVARIIIAGGETSGAITEELGFQSFIIGESVAPGVPVLSPVQNPLIRLVLKSGNFGQADFFIRALDATRTP